MLALSALSAAFSAPQTPFDAYLERPEPDFAWRDTGVNITGPLLFGGVARILNVTSQKWLDESRASGPNGRFGRTRSPSSSRRSSLWRPRRSR